jgi:hypothetical protein
MTANIAFSLCAAALSVAVVALAAVKGDWWVAGVYAALAAGFIARARFGRRAREARAEREGESPPAGPRHEEERRVRPARFRRR